MVVRINKTTSLLVLFLLFIFLISSGVEEGFNNGLNTSYSINKDGVKAKSRKVLEHGIVLDYDDPGANPRHDPRKGKPPKNP